MNKIRLICLSVMTALSAMNVWAGGLLTNTNQSIEFLRNPARDAAIGIDGVYNNPAGVVFLGDGIHVSFNLQNAHQTRTVLTTSPYFPMGIQNGGKDQKEFEGVADAPIIPSLQAAWTRASGASSSTLPSLVVVVSASSTVVSVRSRMLSAA